MAKIRRWWTRTRFAGAAIVTLALLATAITLWPERTLSEAEVRAIVDPDLLVEWPTIPNDENAFMRSWKLSETIQAETGVSPHLSTRPWAQIDERESRLLKTWATAFEPYADDTIRALDGRGAEPKPDLHNKTAWDAGSEPFVCVQALATRAMILCSDGRKEACELAVVDSLRALDRVQGFLVSEIGRSGVDQYRDRVAQLLRDVVTHNWLDSRSLRSVLREVPGEENYLRQYADAARADFTFTYLPLATQRGLFETVRLSSADGPFPVGRLDQEATAKLLSALYVERIANADKPYAGTKWPVFKEAMSYANMVSDYAPSPGLGWLEERVAEVKDRVRVRSIPNYRGRWLLVALGQTPNMHAQELLTRRSTWEGTRLLIAMKIFDQEHGRLPANFGELVTARILRSVPVDPYGDGPFMYDPSLRAFWSAGPGARVRTLPASGRHPFGLAFSL